MIKAITFDLDGTLVNTKDLHRLALNKALRACSKPEIPEKLHAETLCGLPTKVKLLKLGYEEADIAKINHEKQLRTASLVDDLITPDPVVIRTLSMLGAKYPIAIASNCVRNTVDRLIARAGLEHLIVFSLSNEDVDEPKPSPQIYLKAAQKLGVDPWEMLVVEDNPNGMRAAVEAGTRLMPVRGPVDITFEKVSKEIEFHNNMEFSER